VLQADTQRASPSRWPTVKKCCPCRKLCAMSHFSTCFNITFPFWCPTYPPTHSKSKQYCMVALSCSSQCSTVLSPLPPLSGRCAWWPLLSCWRVCTVTSHNSALGTEPTVRTSVIILVLCNLCIWCSILSVDMLQIARNCTSISGTHWCWCLFIAHTLVPP
jgi:hypothetical protein